MYKKSITHIKSKFLLALTLAGLSISLVFAATSDSTVQVSATVNGGIGASSCSASAGAFDFGNYSGTELVTYSSIQVNCGGADIAWTITLDGGNSGNPSNRYMVGSDPANQLAYSITNNSTASAFQSYSSAGDVPMLGLFTVQIPAGQTSATDNYSDSLTLTITF